MGEEDKLYNQNSQPPQQPMPHENVNPYQSYPQPVPPHTPPFQHAPQPQYYYQDVRYSPHQQPYVTYHHAAPGHQHTNYILVDEKELEEVEKSTESTFALCILIFGFFFPILWIGGFFYLKSPSKSARVLSIISVCLFFVTTVALLIGLLVRLL